MSLFDLNATCINNHEEIWISFNSGAKRHHNRTLRLGICPK
jgi:hypothetical protein